MKFDSVVFVDDSEVDNFLNENMMRDAKMAFDVRSYTHPEMAMADIACQNVRPDVVFLDLNMPGMDGWAFLENLQALSEQLIEPPLVVILSGSVDSTDQNKAKAYTFVKGFVSKPLSLNQFRDLAKTLEPIG